jgi:hypothetical protein
MDHHDISIPEIWKDVGYPGRAVPKMVYCCYTSVSDLLIRWKSGINRKEFLFKVPGRP